MGACQGPPEVLRQARVVRQPGDGSCLFHSLAFGLADGSTAASLRRQIADFIEANQELTIADSPLKDWVSWDADLTVPQYCRRMRGGGEWGGGIEMAAAAHLRGVSVLVYEPERGGHEFRRIGTFEPPAAPSPPKKVRIVYQGGVHYDALEAADAAAYGRPASLSHSSYASARGGGASAYPYGGGGTGFGGSSFGSGSSSYGGGSSSYGAASSLYGGGGGLSSLSSYSNTAYGGGSSSYGGGGSSYGGSSYGLGSGLPASSRYDGWGSTSYTQSAANAYSGFGGSSEI